MNTGSEAWFTKWFTTPGRLNILTSLITLVICLVAGWELATRPPVDSIWRGVGQSLLAAGAVTTVAVGSAVAQYAFVTRRYESIVSLGIRRFRRRGFPGSGWPKQLRSVKSKLVFFGKDHNKLLAAHADIIKQLLVDGDVAVTFYLLSLDDDYYRRNKDEIGDRVEAAKALFTLREQVTAISPDSARRLGLLQFRDTPSFSCTLLDQTIIFGPYLHGLKNPDVPEFEIQPGDETWLYDACKSAFESAVAPEKVAELAPPPPLAAAPPTGSVYTTQETSQ